MAINTRTPSPLVLAIAILALVSIGGCAKLRSDGGFGAIAQTAKTRLDKDVRWSRSATDRAAIKRRVSDLLAKTLTVEGAVQVALLNNRGLQASFYELGISDADMVQASRLPNPGFSFGRLKQSSAVELDRGIQFNLARMLMLPMVARMESLRFEQTRSAVTMNMFSLAAQTRKAYYVAVASTESADQARRAMTAAQAGAVLARRQEKVGNWSKLRQAREQSFYGIAVLSVKRSRQARTAARERLIRLMGLSGRNRRLKLPKRLPSLPTAAKKLPNIEQTVLSQRLDVQAEKLAAEQLAKNLGLTKATRFVSVLDLGLERNTFADAPRERGYSIALELPLFDWGTAKVAKAEAIYMQAVHRAAETAVNARSEVREAYAAYRAAYDIARHYRDEIVPLSKRISEENLLRYNGMLIGVFELLADTRSQLESVIGYVNALRDFWLSQANLDMALIGQPSMSSMPTDSISVPNAGAGTH